MSRIQFVEVVDVRYVGIVVVSKADLDLETKTQMNNKMNNFRLELICGIFRFRFIYV